MALKLGRAIAKVLHESDPTDSSGRKLPPSFARKNGEDGKHRYKILIGKDTRVSGYMLEAALEAGFSSVGVDVVLCGPLPTPAVAYLARAQRLSAGVVISASHNPYQDNGIKFFSGLGKKLDDRIEQQIETVLEAPPACVTSSAKWTSRVCRRAAEKTRSVYRRANSPKAAREPLPT